MVESDNTGENTARLMKQQLLVDIKLELVFYHDDANGPLAQIYGSNEPVEVGDTRAARLLRSMTELKDLLHTLKPSDRNIGLWLEPAYATLLDDLETLLKENGAAAVLPPALTGDLLQRSRFRISDYMHWAGGHFTRINPFW